MAQCHGCNKPETEARLRMRRKFVCPSLMAMFCDECFPVWETFDEWADRMRGEAMGRLLASRGEELKAMIAQAEANIEDLPLGSEINLDIHEGIILC